MEAKDVRCLQAPMLKTEGTARNTTHCACAPFPLLSYPCSSHPLRRALLSFIQQMLFLNLYSFSLLSERQKDKKRVRETSHLLLTTSMPVTARAQLYQNPELETWSKSPVWVAGTQVLDHLLSPGVCVNRNLESGAEMELNLGCGHPKWWLNHANACTSINIYIYYISLLTVGVRIQQEIKKMKPLTLWNFCSRREKKI